MPKHVDIEIFNIARTMVDTQAVQKWLDYLGAEDFQLPDKDEVTDPALLIALASKRCYMSFEVGLNPNVTKIRKDYVDYFDNILKSRHGSVLEHSVYSFAIEGVSRVFTGEMNRHRAGWSISEGSMRFIRFDKDIPYWIPTSIQSDENDDEDLANKKDETRAVFEWAFLHTEVIYNKLLQIWDMDEKDKNFTYKKKVTSCLRRIVPMGVATGGVWSGNIRACRHVISMRTAPAAEEEILYVFSKIADYMIESEPMLFGDYKKVDSGSYETGNWKV